MYAAARNEAYPKYISFLTFFCVLFLSFRFLCGILFMFTRVSFVLVRVFGMKVRWWLSVDSTN